MKLRRQVIIYFGVTAVNAVLSFIITTLLTHQIDPDGYGRIYMYSSFLIFLTPFITMGILSPLSVEYFKRSHSLYGVYFTNAQVIPLISLLFFTLLCFILQYPLSGFLKVPVYWIWMMPFAAWWILINDTSQMITRNNNKPVQFAFFAIGKNLAEILLTVLFVLLLQWSWQGRLMSAVVALVLPGAVAILLFFRWKLIEKQIDWKLIKSILLLSTPFIFERLSIFIMNYSGQYVINNSEKVSGGTAEVGLYGLGNTIAQILFLVVASMNYAYHPHIYKKLSEGLKNKLHRTTWWYIVACAATALLIFIGIPILFQFFIGPKFAGAEKYAYMLCAGCFMWGIYNAFQVYLVYIQKRGLIMTVALLGMILSVSLNLTLVPLYGGMGAAAGSIITYSIMALVCFLLVRKYFILKHE